ncbi:MAG: hypothetical protein K0R67_2696 [Paenibacillus sp.]|nr:hypothetical protein [Paenibacillus sp.]
MTCQEAVELMQRDLDHDLSDSERRTMLAHMSRCSECADVYSRLQQLSLELANVPKVLPPFSLVDSILPRLEEIDRLRIQETTEEHLSAASQRTSNQPAASSGSWFSRMRRTFPLSAIGGVVAAGIMLTLFITNQDSMQRKTAGEGPLLNREIATSQASKQETLNDSPERKSASLQAPASDANQDLAKKDQSAPAGSKSGDVPESGVVPTMTPTGAVSTKSAPNSTGFNNQAPKDIEASATNNQQQSEQDKDEPSDGEFADTFSAQFSSAGSTSSPGTEVNHLQDQYGNALGMTDGSHSTEKSADSSSMKSSPSFVPPPNPTPSALLPPLSGIMPGAGTAAGSGESAESVPKMGISIVAQHRLESPDSKHVGIFDPTSRRVTVVQATYGTEVLFTSGHMWSETDRISLAGWRSNTVLAYTVTQGEVSKTYLIDIERKKETVETLSPDSGSAK